MKKECIGGILAPLDGGEKETGLAICRQLLYLAVLVGVTVGMWWVGAHWHEKSVGEYGIIENVQLAVLFAAMVAFGAQAVRCSEWRPISVMLACLCAAAFVRENDAYFENLLPVISWKFCWAFPAAALVYGISCGTRARRLLFAFLRTRSFFMLFSAMVIIIPIAQCVGHRTFIEDMLAISEAQARIVRRAVEEPLELLGYVQILLASIEFYISELRPGKGSSKQA